MHVADLDMRLKRAECPAKVAEIVDKTIKAIIPIIILPVRYSFFLTCIMRMEYIDASFPAESMYLKRGYRIKTYEIIEAEGGDYLCYHTMEKEADKNKIKAFREKTNE